jgi:hypothetical protein
MFTSGALVPASPNRARVTSQTPSGNRSLEGSPIFHRGVCRMRGWFIWNIESYSWRYVLG